MARIGVEGGSKYALEVGSVIRYKIPQQADGVVPSVGFKHPGTETPGTPLPCTLGRVAEPQTDAHSKAENDLITHSAGDRSSEEEQQSQAWPPRSSDLITCDNSLRGTGKEKISQLRLTSVEDLKTATWDCFYVWLSAQKQMSKRTWTRIKQMCWETACMHKSAIISC